MIKKTQIITSTSYTFDQSEVDMIFQCLVYCRHRLKCHPTAGIQNAVNVKHVQKLIDDINK